MSHNIKLAINILKYTIQWDFIPSQYYAIVSLFQFLTIFIYPKETPSSFRSHSRFPNLPHPLAAIILFSASMDLMSRC